MKFPIILSAAVAALTLMSGATSALAADIGPAKIAAERRKMAKQAGE